jgi:hypothetical protein
MLKSKKYDTVIKLTHTVCNLSRLPGGEDIWAGE